MFKRIALVVALSMLSGCTLLSVDEYHKATMNAIQQSESKISNEIVNLELQLNNQINYIDNNLKNHVLSLKTQLHELKTQLHELKKIVDRPKQILESQTQSAQTVSLQTKPRYEVILGEIEKLTIDSINQTFDARIDTGAATSSLNAVNIEEFERDGKKWVHFHLSEDSSVKNEKHWIEAPVLRYVHIRQSTGEQTERRAVVELWVKLGDIHEKTQFTLADRSNMSCPILLGREFIRDIAMVDVSHKYIQTETK